jgi:NADH:ubiquinone oxidoreductase subunit D
MSFTGYFEYLCSVSDTLNYLFPGVVLRGSDVPWDAYSDIEFNVPVRVNGDLL